MKILIRLIALPFVMAICLIPMIRMYIKYIYQFTRYGGEWISNNETLNPKSIRELLEDKLKQDPIQ